MKEPKMTKEEKRILEENEAVYKLNQELVRKVDEMDLFLPEPRYFETTSMTNKYDIRVCVVVEKR
jgi:hypothetical protein